MYTDRQHKYEQVDGLDVTDQEISTLTKFVTNGLNGNEFQKNLLKILNGVSSVRENLTAFQGENKMMATEVQDTITKYKKQTHSDKVKIQELEYENQSLKEVWKTQSVIIENLRQDNSYLKSQNYSNSTNVRSVYSTPEVSFTKELRKDDAIRNYQERLIQADYLAECD